MSKSSKKRRQAAKRQKELEKLRGVSLMDVRGVSLLDEGSPAVPFQSSPPATGNAVNSTNEKRDDFGKRQRSQSHEDASKKQDPAPLPSGSESLSSKRKQIEFVLPRAKGKAQRYVFDKAHANRKEGLSTIPEEETPGRTTSETRAKKNESLDDILFPQKRRRLADKFEAVHRAGETKKEENTENLQIKEEAPSAPLKPKKKKRRRSTSSDKTEEEKKESSDGTKVKPPKMSPESGQSTHVSSVQFCHSIGGGAAFDEAARLQIDMANRQWSGMSVEEAVQDKHGLRPRANSTDGELNLPQRGLCDEQMVLRSHQWQDQHKHAHQVTPRGFVNLGNTCFLNSILQCLAYLPPLCQSLIAISEMKKKQPKNGTKVKPTQGQRITSSLCNLFQKVHGFPENSTHDGSIAPQAIVKALPSLGSIGSRNGYKFWPGRQEDAHEFLVHLLDAMHDGELRAAGINQHTSGWRDRLPVTRLDETTFIHRTFGGYFRSQVRCKACGYCSNTYDPFLDLSLEVSKKSSNSIMQSISEFTRRETLDSDNQWKCSGCKKYVCPTKQLTVFRPPLSLCIQLKRFTFDGGFSSFGGGGGWKYGKMNGGHGGRSKITKPIEFPADLNLPLSDGRSCAYTLNGVVIHVGGSASSGHYTAYVKKPGRNGHAQWYHADDSFVEPVSEKTVLRQKDAYILFYSRKEVKLEFPAPPPRTMSTEEAREFGRARARARADSATIHDESTPKASESILAKDWNVQGARATIHPLAQFLNTTMSEQFAAMSPESTKSEKRSTVEESKDFQGKEMVGKFPTEAFLAKDWPGSNTAEGQAANSKAGETSSESDSLNDDSSDGEVAGRTKLAAVGSGPDFKQSRAVASSSDSDSSESESENEKDAKPRAEKSQGEASSSSPSLSSSSSSSSESESSESEADALPKSQKGPSPVSSNPGKPKMERLAFDEPSSESESSDSQKSSEEAAESEKLPLYRPSPNSCSVEKTAVSQTQAEDSSSESSSSDSGSESEVEDKPESPKPSAQSPAPSPISSAKPNAENGSANRTRVVVGSADSRGKVKVMMGPRKRQAWVPKTMATIQKGAAFQLLGNMGVSRWDEGDDKTAGSQPSQMSRSTLPLEIERDQIVKTMEKQDNSRKRKMYLDRWDSLLDQGKVKKTKKNSESSTSNFSANPTKNVFQRIQTGIQRMNKGKAKGLFRRKTNDGDKRKPGRR